MRRLPLLCLLITACARPTLQPDEQVLFFPSVAQLQTDGSAEVQVNAWVFEMESHTITTAGMKELTSLLPIEGLGSEGCSLLPEHARYFFADNERAKRLVITLDGQSYPLEATDAAGHSSTHIHLSAQALAAAQQSQPGSPPLAFTVAPGGSDTRVFTGEAVLLAPEGLSIISDIDDTIKVSEVRDKRALMLNTFCRAFRAVPGMAELYQTWATTQGAQFHYVSASPWHLYPLLAEFRSASHFPAGTWAMKDFRLKDKTALNLTESAADYKPSRIDPLMKAYPQRRFVLVGDSGELDPEIYAGVARRFPEQVVRIFIRDVTQETREAPRYVAAFKDLPPDLWQLFTDPSALTTAIPPTTVTKP